MDKSSGNKENNQDIPEFKYDLKKMAKKIKI